MARALTYDRRTQFVHQRFSWLGVQVDLLVERQDSWILVEVKTGSLGEFAPVKPDQMRRLWRVAESMEVTVGLPVRVVVAVVAHSGRIQWLTDV